MRDCQKKKKHRTGYARTEGINVKLDGLRTLVSESTATGDGITWIIHNIQRLLHGCHYLNRIRREPINRFLFRIDVE